VRHPHDGLSLSPGGAAPKARKLFAGSRESRSPFYDDLHDWQKVPVLEEECPT
jgi:hypothetical protein